MPAKPKNNGGRRSIDWEKLKLEYMADPKLSLRKLAVKHGVSFTTVKTKSKADNWFAAKIEHQKNVASLAASKLATIQADNLVTECLVADALAHQILDAINADPLLFRKHFLTKNLEEEECVCDQLNTKAMKDAISIAKMAEDMKRTILSIQRIENIQKHEIDSRRVAVEEARLEWEKQKAEYAKPDSSNSIRIEGFEEGWSE